MFEAAGRRNAQPACAVLEPPIAVDGRPETGVPQPAIGVHGRAADRSQGIEMIHHAADGPQSNLPGLAPCILTGGKKTVLSALAILKYAFHPRQGILPQAVDPVLAAAPEREVMMAAVAETPMNGLHMKHALRSCSRATCAQICR